MAEIAAQRIKHQGSIHEVIEFSAYDISAIQDDSSITRGAGLARLQCLHDCAWAGAEGRAGFTLNQAQRTLPVATMTVDMEAVFPELLVGRTSTSSGLTPLCH
ncbi:MAG: hypothetical protein ACKO22_08815 [Cyanobium sp.]